jgi:serine/threonine-protein kinase HipA
LTFAEEFVIKNPRGIIEDVQVLIPRWSELATELQIPEKIITKIKYDLEKLN